MRRRHEGLANMANWSDAIGRSSRVLLGLERGEPTGAKTLRRIEEVLHWPPGYADRILEDQSADPAPDMPPELTERFEPFMPEPRPLDAYTTAELLQEIEDRYDELSLEVHSLGRPAVTSRQEGTRTIIEPMSPAARREAMRRGVGGTTARERPIVDTADVSQE